MNTKKRSNTRVKNQEILVTNFDPKTPSQFVKAESSKVTRSSGKDKYLNAMSLPMNF